MAFIAQEGRRAFMIRVGIAGIGYIAEEYIKLFSQGKIKNAELHALSSRNYAHMEEIKNTYHLTDARLQCDARQQRHRHGYRLHTAFLPSGHGHPVDRTGDPYFD